jgi:hypothetical protein
VIEECSKLSAFINDPERVTLYIIKFFTKTVMCVSFPMIKFFQFIGEFETNSQFIIERLKLCPRVIIFKLESRKNNEEKITSWKIVEDSIRSG